MPTGKKKELYIWKFSEEEELLFYFIFSQWNVFFLFFFRNGIFRKNIDLLYYEIFFFFLEFLGEKRS